MPRICDRLLEKKMRSSGAVLVIGCKWCGKTMTASQLSKSVLYMQDPDKTSSLLALADTKPSLLLKGENPRLIDEWQIAPVLWDAVRFEVDQRNTVGQFILTGSAVPKDNTTSHTGTGRISRLLMRPMSLFESKESNEEVSLKSLFNGEQEIMSTSNLSIEQIAYVICRGGWPASIGIPSKDAIQMSIDYVDAIINQDISRVDGVEKNPTRNDGDVFHYRDKTELEADMIISLRDGRWAAVEVKLGNKQIEDAAVNLKKLAAKVNTEKMGVPSFLMVLTGGEFAYRREDGVFVVPIGCLRD